MLGHSRGSRLDCTESPAITPVSRRAAAGKGSLSSEPVTSYLSLPVLLANFVILEFTPVPSHDLP